MIISYPRSTTIPDRSGESCNKTNLHGRLFPYFLDFSACLDRRKKEDVSEYNLKKAVIKVNMQDKESLFKTYNVSFTAAEKQTVVLTI